MSRAKKIQAVYLIKNVVSGAYYYGSSKNVYERWRGHRNKLRVNKHPNSHVQSSWNKYGEDAFKFEILAEFESLDEMDMVEEALIQENISDPLCMNQSMWAKTPMRGVYGPANPRYGTNISDAQKQALSEAAKRQWAREDPRTGKKHSAETRAKISEKIQQALAEGRGGKFIPSEETRQKMSQSLKGNKCALGVKRSEEERRAMSERMRGNKNWLGKKHTKESRQKMSKRVREVTSGKEFDSLTAVLEEYGLKMPTLRRALVSGKPLSKGPNKGLQFEYLDA